MVRHGIGVGARLHSVELLTRLTGGTMSPKSREAYSFQSVHLTAPRSMLRSRAGNEQEHSMHTFGDPLQRAAQLAPDKAAAEGSFA